MSTCIEPAVLIKGLVAVRAQLQKGWTQGRNARDRRGDGTLLWPSPGEPPPVCWCLHGAVATVAHAARPRHSGAADDLQGAIGDALDAALRHIAPDFRSSLGAHTYVAYNDAPGRKVEEIIALVDAAIVDAGGTPC